MMKPITIKSRAPVKYQEAEDVWTLERIHETWGEDGDGLVPQLARQCTDLQAEVDRLKKENARLRSYQHPLLGDNESWEDE